MSKKAVASLIVVVLLALLLYSCYSPYVDCTDLRSDYPRGVRFPHPVYALTMDGDKDGHACEPYRRRS